MCAGVRIHRSNYDWVYRKLYLYLIIYIKNLNIIIIIAIIQWIPEV